MTFTNRTNRSIPQVNSNQTADASFEQSLQTLQEQLRKQDALLNRLRRK